MRYQFKETFWCHAAYLKGFSTSLPHQKSIILQLVGCFCHLHINCHIGSPQKFLRCCFGNMLLWRMFGENDNGGFDRTSWYLSISHSWMCILWQRVLHEKRRCEFIDDFSLYEEIHLQIKNMESTKCVENYVT